MFVDIQSKDELLARAGEISSLFKTVFGADFSFDEWKWFYINNPAGMPVVSLFYEHDELMAHYAVVPTRLSWNAKSFVAYRSMTTMCHPKAMGRGLFKTLAQRVYARLEADRASMVYGFPNKNSSHGFTKYLGWTLPDVDSVYDLSGEDILRNQALCTELTAADGITWDLNDPTQMAWRTTRPDADMMSVHGLITKRHDMMINILSVTTEGLQNLKPKETYRVLVPSSVDPTTLGGRFVFNYQFGYRLFDPHFSTARFNRALIMSDVF